MAATAATHGVESNTNTMNTNAACAEKAISTPSGNKTAREDTIFSFAAIPQRSATLILQSENPKGINSGEITFPIVASRLYSGETS